jgi:hypothetical protein
MSRAAGLVVVWLWVVSGCGASLENSALAPASGEDASLEARGWHERVVALESETRRAMDDARCDDACLAAARACTMTGQICAVADEDGHDEGTRMLCDDAQGRCDAARTAAASGCACEAGAP